MAEFFFPIFHFFYLTRVASLKLHYNANAQTFIRPQSLIIDGYCAVFKGQGLLISLILPHYILESYMASVSFSAGCVV